LNFFSSLRRLTPPWLQYLFWIFSAGMMLSSGFRLLLLVMNLNLIDPQAAPYLILSFYHGLAFDARVISGVVVLPYLFLAGFWLAGSQPRWLIRSISIFFMAVFAFVIGFSISDPPYFDYYGSRLSNDILTWSDHPGLMLEVLLADWSFMPYIICGFLIGFLFWYLILRIEVSCFRNPDPAYKGTGKSVVFLLSFTGLFLGMRGDYDFNGKPAVTADAFFCDFTFVNQLALNPVFNLVDSYYIYVVEYTDDETALKKAQEYLAVQPLAESPVARRIVPGQVAAPGNVVLIIMESQTAWKTSYYPQAPQGLTPFLDSLAGVSLFFPNTFTTGVHTRNGIYGTLTGFPTLMGNRPMQASIGNGVPYGGFPVTLKNLGYSTAFFCTGKKDFDNMGGFLSFNGFDSVYSQANYPPEEVFNKWGVTDHFMFTWSVPKLRALHQQGNPFFATFLTISGHEKTALARPPGFTPTAATLDDQRFQLQDFSIREFFKSVQQEPWFPNTLFILIADHGFNADPQYNLPLCYHQTPLIFFRPGLPKPASDEKLALQIDVFPTAMGLLNLPYVNNTLGVDLQTHSRPYAYFSNGTNIGCLGDEYYLILNSSGKEFLYRYKTRDENNLADEMPEVKNRMKDYVLTMFQTTQWMLQNRKTGLITGASGD